MSEKYKMIYLRPPLIKNPIPDWEAKLNDLSRQGYIVVAMNEFYVIMERI